MLDLAQRLEGTLGDYTVKDGCKRSHPGPRRSPCMNSSRRRALSLRALRRCRVTGDGLKRCGSHLASDSGRAAVGIEVPIAAARRFT